jgi:CRISPR-associated protein Csm4
VEWLELPKDWQDIIGFKQANSYSLISLFWELPLPDYLNHAPTTAPLSYVLQQRGGWIASPSSGRQLRRQSVNMFAEGSVFPVEPEGKLADVTPGNFDQTPHGHKVYRSGIALSLPIKVERSE